MAEFAAVIVTIGIILAGDSAAGDLRPSDHGLVFQISPAAGVNSSPEMRSFFNSKNTSPASSSSDVALPRAMNSGDPSPPSWWRSPSAGGDGDGDGDRVGAALLVASLVCGIAGVVLFVASGLIYLFKYRKHKLNESFNTHGENDNDEENNNNNNNDNKLQLVVRDP